MDCAFCAATAQPDARFCAQCGAPLDLRKCANCDALSSKESPNCVSCGAPTPVTEAPDGKNSLPDTSHNEIELPDDKNSLGDGSRNELKTLLADLEEEVNRRLAESASNQAAVEPNTPPQTVDIEAGSKSWVVPAMIAFALGVAGSALYFLLEEPVGHPPAPAAVTAGVQASAAYLPRISTAADPPGIETSKSAARACSDALWALGLCQTGER